VKKCKETISVSQLILPTDSQPGHTHPY